MKGNSIVLNDVHLSFPRNRIGVKSILRWLKRRTGKDATIPPFDALKGVSLSVKKGEILGVIGKNGSGKSTLLRVMSGIYQPDRGQALASGPVNLLSNVRVGFNGNLSGRENVYLYGSILGHSRQIMNELMHSIIEFSELEAFMDQPLRTYSSGMQARLGLSVASAVQPEILLIDEVLAVGDEEFKERSRERIKSMVEDAATVVIVSHNLNYLKQVCDRFLLIENGCIEAEGNPEEIILAYRERMKR
jgi:ABC-2 type transport system ATP-binding protein